MVYVCARHSSFLELSTQYIYQSYNMPSSLFNCLLCFRKRHIITDATPITCDSSSETVKGSATPTSFVEKDILRTEEKPLEEEKTITSGTPVTPRVNRALAVVAKREYAIVEDYPYPSISHDREVIISSRAVGLNPIDWKSVDYNFCLPAFPWVTGREMAGVIEQVGSGVTNFKVGQRVWTSKSLFFLRVSSV